MNTNGMQIFTGRIFLMSIQDAVLKVLFTFQISRAQTTQTREIINDCKQQKGELYTFF